MKLSKEQRRTVLYVSNSLLEVVHLQIREGHALNDLLHRYEESLVQITDDCQHDLAHEIGTVLSRINHQAEVAHKLADALWSTKDLWKDCEQDLLDSLAQAGVNAAMDAMAEVEEEDPT